MISDDVISLANKRVIYLVWRSGQSNSSAFMILCSSEPGENSTGVFLDEVIKFVIISGGMDEF